MTTNTSIPTTGFVALINDPNDLGALYGYGRTEDDAIKDAVRYMQDNGPDGLSVSEDDFYTIPATEAMSKTGGAPGDFKIIETPAGEVCVAAWEAKDIK